MKGMAPEFLRFVIIPASLVSILLALEVSPTVALVPWIGMFSLTEMGIPNKGGRYFSISH